MKKLAFQPLWMWNLVAWTRTWPSSISSYLWAPRITSPDITLEQNSMLDWGILIGFLRNTLRRNGRLSKRIFWRSKIRHTRRYIEDGLKLVPPNYRLCQFIVLTSLCLSLLDTGWNSFQLQRRLQFSRKIDQSGLVLLVRATSRVPGFWFATNRFWPVRSVN